MYYFIDIKRIEHNHSFYFIIFLLTDVFDLYNIKLIKFAGSSNWKLEFQIWKVYIMQVAKI